MGAELNFRSLALTNILSVSSFSLKWLDNQYIINFMIQKTIYDNSNCLRESVRVYYASITITITRTQPNESWNKLDGATRESKTHHITTLPNPTIANQQMAKKKYDRAGLMNQSFVIKVQATWLHHQLCSYNHKLRCISVFYNCWTGKLHKTIQNTEKEKKRKEFV